MVSTGSVDGRKLGVVKKRCRALWWKATALKVVGSKTGEACDTRKHLRADLLAVMESENKIRPALPLKNAVRAGLPLDGPTDALEGC